MHHGEIAKPIADGLIELRKRIAQGGIPSSKLDETLNLATWNIREFGRKPRSDAALHYIAEILGQFDLIGIVELRDNLADLEKSSACSRSVLARRVLGHDPRRRRQPRAHRLHL